MTRAAPTVSACLWDLARHPVRHLVCGWNWKSSVLSSICRAGIFLAVNLSAGVDAGVRAMLVELVFRALMSGALGSATQAFRTATPAVTATLTALLVIPGIGHLAEYAVHRTAGTARLGESILASVTFSALTTAFNLFAMRRGALIVGPEQRSLLEDMRRIPWLGVAFVKAALDRVGRLRRNGGTWLFRLCI